MSHVLTQENHPEALEAVRDILLMFTEVAEDRMFIHGAEYGIRFDPLKFVDAVQDTAASYYLDVDLLRTGSALVIFAAFYTGWTEERGVHAFEDTERYMEAVRAGRLRHVPDVERVLIEFFEGRHSAPDDPWFDQESARLCSAHVQSYFSRLAEGRGSGRGPPEWVRLQS